MFEMLVPRFKDGIHQSDDQGDSVLMSVIKNSADVKGRCESARTLLVEGAVSGDGCHEDEKLALLRAARQHGRTDVMDLLLVRVGGLSPFPASDE
jgi:Ni2+-binding GTPase involved in maturation of urease and hydrogenase